MLLDDGERHCQRRAHRAAGAPSCVGRRCERVGAHARSPAVAARVAGQRIGQGVLRPVVAIGVQCEPDTSTGLGDVARTFRWRVGNVDKFSVSPFWSGPMSTSKSASMSVKLTTAWGGGGGGATLGRVSDLG